MLGASQSVYPHDAVHAPPSDLQTMMQVARLFVSTHNGKAHLSVPNPSSPVMYSAVIRQQSKPLAGSVYYFVQHRVLMTFVWWKHLQEQTG